MNNAQQPVVLITGASNGVGLATAKRLSAAGCKVYGVARRPFEDADIRMFCADVCDVDAMSMVLKSIVDAEGRLDVLVSNVGCGIGGTVECAHPDEMKRMTDTNLTSAMILTQLAIPYLKATAGRLIYVSSVGGAIPLPYQACYSATKAALDYFGRAVATEVRRYKMKVSIVLPGDLNTGFTAARIVHCSEDEQEQRSVKKAEEAERKGKSPDTVARVIQKCVFKRRPPLRVTVGFGYKAIVAATRFLPVKWLNGLVKKFYC